MRKLTPKSSILKKTKPQDPRDRNTNQPQASLPASLSKKLEILQPVIDRSDDLVMKKISIGRQEKMEARALFVDGVIDAQQFNDHILESLMLFSDEEIDPLGSDFISLVGKKLIAVGKVKNCGTYEALVNNLFDGMLILIFDGIQDALVVDIHGGQFRTIADPPTEKAVKGPREGFIENLDINLSIIRRRLHDPQLVIKKSRVGQRTRNGIALIYLEDIADPEILAELQQKLDNIDIDGVHGASYIEQMIDANPYSVFPQF